MPSGYCASFADPGMSLFFVLLFLKIIFIVFFFLCLFHFTVYFLFSFSIFIYISFLIYISRFVIKFSFLFDSMIFFCNEWIFLYELLKNNFDLLKHFLSNKECSLWTMRTFFTLTEYSFGLGNTFFEVWETSFLNSWTFFLEL
jgi:hypothetical protein